MLTLQEQFEKDYPDKNVKEIDASGKYWKTNFTNYDLGLREYVNLTSLKSSSNKLTSIDLSKCKNLNILILSNNKLSSVDFLNTLPNPKNLETLWIPDNKIQPTDIEFFSRFINLNVLKIGTNNKFYGSLKSYQSLTKLEEICIEATDVNEGLEYLPMSLVSLTKGGDYDRVECSPHNTNAKCSQIQDQLRPFNYDLEAWQLAHPHKMYKARPELFELPESREKWLEAVITKIEKSQQKLEGVKIQEPNKVKKIKRMELKIDHLNLIKKLLEERSVFEDSLETGVRWYDKFKEDKYTQTDLTMEQIEEWESNKLK